MSRGETGTGCVDRADCHGNAGATTAAAPMVVPFVPFSTYYILVAGTGRYFQLVCLSVTRSRAMVFGLPVESRSRETGSREGLWTMKSLRGISCFLSTGVLHFYPAVDCATDSTMMCLIYAL